MICREFQFQVQNHWPGWKISRPFLPSVLPKPNFYLQKFQQEFQQIFCILRTVSVTVNRVY